MSGIKALTCVGNVLSIELDDGASHKCVLPKGERGAPGRDGISIRGDKGEKGEQGIPGRDSVVPGVRGEKGDKGDPGAVGATPVISIGKVDHGDAPKVYLHGTPEAPVMDFVLPRGVQGIPGRAGKDGKDGSHEYIDVLSLGHSPLFSDEWFAKHIIADGIISLPRDLPEEAVGRWVWIKTFDRAVINGTIEEFVSVEKNQSAKLVVVPYGDKFLFTKF
jgi:hypothetical protein